MQYDKVLECDKTEHLDKAFVALEGGGLAACNDHYWDARKNDKGSAHADGGEWRVTLCNTVMT